MKKIYRMRSNMLLFLVYGNAFSLRLVSIKLNVKPLFSKNGTSTRKRKRVIVILRMKRKLIVCLSLWQP
jgi:hypothetical protein